MARMETATRMNVLQVLVVGGAAAYVGGRLGPVGWTPLRIFGLCLAVAGFVLWATARLQLGSSFAITAQARHLVTTGVYSKIRNPIYVFGSMFMAGYLLLLAEPIWLLMFVVIVPLQVWRARKEARVLEAAFGDEYRAWRAKTWF